MKKTTGLVFIITVLLSVSLSACRTTAEPGKEMSESLPYQFVKKYGILQSEYPVYELDTVIISELPRKEKIISLTFAVRHNQELIVSMILDDSSELERIPAGGEPPADGLYHTLNDGTMVVSERYQEELWKSGEGLFLTGPGIPEAGIKPQESVYAFDSEYLEWDGHKRYFIEAKFELPEASAPGTDLTGYGLRLLDFEEPLEFALKRAPEYETLEELAAKEQGGIDTHDGISVISMGERVKEGIIVSWYAYCEAEQKQMILTYKPPLQEMDMPTISGKEKQYPIMSLPGNPYRNITGLYGLSEVRRYGRRFQCLFDVPQEEQKGAFQINIPGITFLEQEESLPVTLPIPEDHEELNTDIPYKEGSVRILGITRMKEPQAVYLDVAAVNEDKNLALKRLLCERKTKGGGWERGRYDFDEKGNLSGFRVFYEEGDSSVTVKFFMPAFYWDQPYVMELPLAD